MEIRELAGDLARKAQCPSLLVPDRGLKCRCGLGLSTQLIEQNAPMDVGFDVARIERKRLLELSQRELALADHGEAEAEQMMDIRKALPGLQHRFEQVSRPVIVLESKALPGLGEEGIRADVHARKITTVSA